MVMAYAPANCFQPTKTSLGSMRNIEKVHFMADYEFFREKAWQYSHVLMHLTELVKYR